MQHVLAHDVGYQSGAIVAPKLVDQQPQWLGRHKDGVSSPQRLADTGDAFQKESMLALGEVLDAAIPGRGPRVEYEIVDVIDDLQPARLRVCQEPGDVFGQLHPVEDEYVISLQASPRSTWRSATSALPPIKRTCSAAWSHR